MPITTNYTEGTASGLIDIDLMVVSAPVAPPSDGIPALSLAVPVASRMAGEASIEEDAVEASRIFLELRGEDIATLTRQAKRRGFKANYKLVALDRQFEALFTGDTAVGGVTTHGLGSFGRYCDITSYAKLVEVGGTTVKWLKTTLRNALIVKAPTRKVNDKDFDGLDYEFYSASPWTEEEVTVLPAATTGVA